MSSPITQQLFRRRMPAGVVNTGVPDSIVQVIDEPDSSVTLKRSMSTFQLTLIGVGGTIGTGIFFILSEAVPKAGPAVLISFILAAVVAGLTVVCYAELASMMPSSGSSYSYTYATMGEMTLKGLNRKVFENALLKTLRKRAEGLGQPIDDPGFFGDPQKAQP